MYYYFYTLPGVAANRTIHLSKGKNHEYKHAITLYLYAAFLYFAGQEFINDNKPGNKFIKLISTSILK